jgi:hypothetical protein
MDTTYNTYQETSPYITNDTSSSRESTLHEQNPYVTYGFYVFVIIIILLVSYYILKSTGIIKEPYLNASDRSDPAVDDNILTQKIEQLNKMQSENIHS